MPTPVSSAVISRWKIAVRRSRVPVAFLTVMAVVASLIVVAHAHWAQSSPSGAGDARALAAGEFHGDGTVDVIAGFADGNAGFVVLYRANPAAQTPRTRPGLFVAARSTPGASPFLPGGEAFATPEPPDFIGVGDFNCDGHKDLVVAARGGHALYLLAGDGKGGFGAPERIELPGAVTALVTGEINRADGLEDMAVAVNGVGGPQVLVFESQRGALRDNPEVFGLPAPATALALGRLAGSYTFDLAVAAGDQLLIIEGRDRKMYLKPAMRGDVPPARIHRLSLPFSIASLAEGHFQGRYQSQLAVLSEYGEIHLVRQSNAEEQRTGAPKAAPEFEVSLLAGATGSRPTHLTRARISGSGADDLVVLDGAARQLRLHAGGRAAAAQAPLQATSAPVAVLPLEWEGRTKRGLVVLQSGSTAPTLVAPAAPTTLTVNTTSDVMPPPGSSLFTLREGSSLSTAALSARSTQSFSCLMPPPTLAVTQLAFVRSSRCRRCPQLPMRFRLMAPANPGSPAIR
jgi:hypothetical protein